MVGVQVSEILQTRGWITLFSVLKRKLERLGRTAHTFAVRDTHRLSIYLRSPTEVDKLFSSACYTGQGLMLFSFSLTINRKMLLACQKPMTFE